MPRDAHLRRTLAVAAAGAAMALGTAPASAADAPSQLPCIPGATCADDRPPACRGAATQPVRGNLRAIRRATLCLLNRERTERGLARLRANRPLRRVATRYARSMVRLRFFDHVSPGGSTFVERIERSAYLDPGDRYSLGENLAWGGGPQATPEQIVRSWMRSPGHRANILNGDFRDIGVGVALGVPVAGLDGATYVNEFGRRGR